MNNQKTMAGGARTNTSDKSWKRVEIYWSNSSEDDWSIDKYYAPVYNEIEKNGTLKSALYTPNLQNGVASDTSVFSKNIVDNDNETSDIAVKKVLQEAREILKHGKSDGIICTDVSQWVIIEVETYKPIVENDYATYPNLHIWSFLQPLEIGNTDSMKKNMGFVIDDIPRSGWYEAQLQWNYSVRSEYDPVKKCYAPRYMPRFYRLKPGVNGTSEIVDIVQCESSTPDAVRSKIIYKLIKESGQSECFKIQVKVKLTIRNEETSHDRMKKNNTLYESFKKKLEEELKKQGKNDSEIKTIVDDKLKSIMRFEGGSYVKIWVRNLDYTWAVSMFTADVEDDESERNMVNMQELDCPSAKEQDRFTFRNYNNTPEIEKGEKIFRPYSFRNHNWKRNKITLTRYGAGSQDKNINLETVFILLFPEDVIRHIDNLLKLPEDKKSTFQIPDWLWPVSVIVIFIVIVTLLRKAKDGLKDADPVKLDKKKSQLQTSFDILDLPKIFAQLATITPPENISQITKLIKNAKLSAVFAGDTAAMHNLNPTQKICQFFYVLFNQFYALMLKSSDDDYKKFTEGREKLAKSFWNEKNVNSVKQKIKLFDANESLITFSSTLKDKQRKVGGKPIVFPGLFAWAAWRSFFNMGYKLGSELSVKLDETQNGLAWEIGGAFSPEGFLGVVTEIGTVLSMLDLKEKGETNQAVWGFEETLKYIIMWLDIRAGASLKLTLKGKFGGKFRYAQEFVSTAKTGVTDVKKTSNFSVLNDTSASINIDGTLYAYLTNLFTIDYGALKFNLLTLTSNSLTIAGDGLWLCGNDVLNGKGIGWNWGDIGFSSYAQFVNHREYCLGEIIKVSALMRGITDEKLVNCELNTPRGGIGTDNNSFVNISCINSNKEITAVDPPVDDPASRNKFDKKITIDCKFNFDRKKIAITDDFQHIFLGRLVKESQQVYATISSGNATKSYTKNERDANRKCISVKQPLIRNFSLNNTSGGLLTTKSKMQLIFEIDNLATIMPLYLSMFEIDTLGGNDICSYKGIAYYEIPYSMQKSVLDKVTVSTVLDLADFNIAKQTVDFRVAGIGPAPKADIALGISFDTMGDIRLMFETNGKQSRISPVTHVLGVIY